MERFSVVVVGGGHAGVEAAAAAARRGARVALVTQHAETIGVMSCNPSIGGVGKGHLVRELDVFDGLMARAADAAAIHHRMLNRSKGAAVRGPRIQADRRRYRAAVQSGLDDCADVVIVQAEVADLRFSNGVIAGVVLSDGGVLATRAVVLATGTFLGGRIFCGEERLAGGRVGEAPATVLGQRMRDLGLPLGRLKTGTPPRLNGRTIDWARLPPQPSDTDPWTMSPYSAACCLPQVACAITHTNPATHDAIRADLGRSPLYAGAIDGRGPRYCPSIEDKIVRFADRTSHQIFLEPEGLDDSIVYPNGISTSLPIDTQAALIATIAGLEHAVITTPGYAVEYDYLDPRALDHQLALRVIGGLFCAGQINGTTGYEEAAAQGLIAGLNAAAYALDIAPVLFDRAESYIGVMIDDLVLQGISEPYRVLTARAEYRLTLRADNAEQRLGHKALAAGALRPDRAVASRIRADQREALRNGVASPEDTPPDIVEEIEEDRRYAPYIERQAREIARMRADAAIMLPSMSELESVRGLSTEMIERLRLSAPTTLDQATRVPGVTPAALTALWLFARQRAPA